MLPSGVAIEAEVLVIGFGATNGMLVFSDPAVIKEREKGSEREKEAGVFFSQIGPDKTPDPFIPRLPWCRVWRP